MIGFVDPYQQTAVPAGLIVPWTSNSTTPPTGWAFVTPPNTGVSGFSGCYIVGAGSTYTVGQSGIGGSPAGHVQFNTTYDGNHQGTRIDTICGPTSHASWFLNCSLTGGEYGGNHYHQIDATPTIGYNQCQLIKATSQTEKFPGKAVLFNTIHSNLSWLTQVGTDGKYLRAGNSYASASTSLSMGMPGTDPNENTEHVHNWGGFYDAPRALGTTVTNWRIWTNTSYATCGHDGGHSHQFISKMVNDYIKKVYTTAWTYASAFYGFRGMIALWDGAIGSIPAGWAVCDGTNGSIDMRDHFIMMSTTANKGTRTGTNVIDIVPESGNMLASDNFGVGLGYAANGHQHFERYDCEPAGTGGNIAVKVRHPAYFIPHDHPLTQGTSLSYTPQFCALYIIQKL